MTRDPAPLPWARLPQYVELVTRILAVPLGISAFVICILILKHETNLPFFIAAVCVSFLCNIIDGTCLSFDLHHQTSASDSYRASPRWRGVIDVTLLVALLLSLLNMGEWGRKVCSVPNAGSHGGGEEAGCGDKKSDRLLNVALVLGTIVACAHFWISTLSCFECFHRGLRKDRERRERRAERAELEVRERGGVAI